MASVEDVLRSVGIVANPNDVIESARLAGLPVDINAAKLLKESYGGKNVFGNDRVQYPKSGAYTADTVLVTSTSCAAYLRWRGSGRSLRKDRQNGVGPCQLTYYVFQDEAEKLGGLHVPVHNMRVGAKEMARCLRAANGDIAEAGSRYNGGDRWRSAAPAKREFARKYGQDLLAKTIMVRRALSGATSGGGTSPSNVPPVIDASHARRRRVSIHLMTT